MDICVTDEATILNSDAELVRECLRGNRDAFGRIVERYQTLVCSIAYSATGNLSRSEDLAQETFIAAWRQLGTLREPGKLKSWLSGIARNLVHNARRREQREPANAGEQLEKATADPELTPTEEAISHEEQMLLWRALGQIPEIYREPMVLFYRENQSVGQVAEELELTENAVKQRLARGRKLLSSELEKFVEGALTRSAPSRAFTFGVLAALPMLPVSATAATAGATAAKGSAAANAMGWIEGLGAMVGPLVGILGAWIGVRSGLANAKSERERRFIIKSALWSSAVIMVFLFVLCGFIFLARDYWRTYGPQLAFALAGFVLLYVLVLVVSVFTLNRRLRAIQLEEAGGRIAIPQHEKHEYKSRLSFLGWPLLHVHTGRDAAGKLCVARGWIAVGNIAFGGLSFGGLAFGGLCFGGCSLGLISLGGAALGAFAFGGLGIGWLSVAGIAIGVQALGGCAIGWHAALGGLALARDYALGGMAWAGHANDQAARAVIEGSIFLRMANGIMKHGTQLGWLPLLFLTLQMWWLQKRK